MDVWEAAEHLRLPNVRAAVFDMLYVNSDGRSGLDLLQFVRSERSLQELPVIMLTGFELNAGVVDEVRKRSAELWHKPVDPFRLIERLQQLVHQVSARTDESACPTCRGRNVQKTAETLRSTMYICFDCHQTFTQTRRAAGVTRATPPNC
jgi:DNA-binding NtrC family response regulator